MTWSKENPHPAGTMAAILWERAKASRVLRAELRAMARMLSSAMRAQRDREGQR